MLKKVLQRRMRSAIATAVDGSPALNRALLLNGAIAARQVQAMDRIQRLADVEFRVFSQWGEDGILEWIVHHYGDMPRSFIEFGVEDYRESNTRFLLQNRNWRGLVMDGSDAHVAHIRQDEISWKHDLTAVSRFITTDNIDEIIQDAGFSGEVGILSVDIDGNDYWVWKAISNLKPHVIVAEYNSTFGDVHPITIPYRPDFYRTNAHASNVYYGASIKAFEHLAAELGYALIGSNGAGTNAFFVRQERAEFFALRIADTGAYPTRVRESRGAGGEMSLLGTADRIKLMGDQIVHDVVTGNEAPLRTYENLLSEKWTRYLRGE